MGEKGVGGGILSAGKCSFKTGLDLRLSVRARWDSDVGEGWRKGGRYSRECCDQVDPAVAAGGLDALRWWYTPKDVN